MPARASVAALLLALVGCAAGDDLTRRAAATVDHHQHLFREGLPRPGGNTPAIDAAELVRLLDAAKISRAVVLSLGYQPGNPNRPAPPEEYAQVRAENDWTSRQVARFPRRLIGFCGFNPLRAYALEELHRCARDPHLRRGIKLHFGNSDVQLDNSAHLQQLRQIFAAANEQRMAVIIHLRASVSQRRPHGAAQAKAFLEQVLPSAPDVPIQIAHLAGAGGYDDPSTDETLAAFIDAFRANDPRMKNVYFDVSGVAGIGAWRDKADLIARRIRELGTQRVLYGSDGALPGNLPAEAWTAFSHLPLTTQELAAIARNVAPYMTDRRSN